jgi:undecaprenyl-diphosphatase
LRDILNAVILGIIEGLTEFLPISSTGHLVIAMPMLGIDATQPPWNVLLWVSQLGAIAAVVVYFWSDLSSRTFRAADPLGRVWTNHLITKLAVAMIPTTFAALLFKKALDPLEQMPIAVAVALIAGALLMAWIDRRFRHNRPQELEDVTLAQAAWIGAIQAISMVPGISRSGAGIMGGMVLGLSPRVATEFSFYLAIPTMLAASTYAFWKKGGQLTSESLGLVLVGTGTSFLVALVVIAGFMRFVRTQRFTPFVVYRIALGLAVLAFTYAM